jgi:hypothetical protein
MHMSLILARRFIVVCASVLLLHSGSLAADCDSQQLTPQQKLERFQELDKHAQTAMQLPRCADPLSFGPWKPPRTISSPGSIKSSENLNWRQKSFSA